MAYVVTVVFYINSRLVGKFAVCIRPVLPVTQRHASCRRLATRRFKCINRRIVLVIRTGEGFLAEPRQVKSYWVYLSMFWVLGDLTSSVLGSTTTNKNKNKNKNTVTYRTQRHGLNSARCALSVGFKPCGHSTAPHQEHSSGLTHLLTYLLTHPMEQSPS